MNLRSAGSEKYLLEALDRIAKNSSKYSALYVSISKLQPRNRHPAFVKILAKLFDSIIGSAMGAFFVLSNGDFVILGTKVSPELVDITVKKLKLGLAKDPIIHTSDTSSFVRLYNFPEDLATLYVMVTNFALAQEKVEEIDIKRPLQNFEVDNVLAKMDYINFANLIKRQSVLKVHSATKFEVLSQEFFIAVKDLSKEYDNNVDLTINKWMFIYLTETLDKKALNALFQSSIVKMPKEISLNLNLSSVFSTEFLNWTKNFLSKDCSLMVEVQLMDVFNNMSLYFEVKELLHQAGHKILIDALSPQSLRMINIKTLNPDKVKLFWEPLMEFDLDNHDIKNLVQNLGADNVILAKTTNTKAFKWGIGYGIKAFQGPYMDDLETAMIKSRCPNAKICTNLSCLKRRRLITGSLRDECQHIGVLETLLEAD